MNIAKVIEKSKNDISKEAFDNLLQCLYYLKDKKVFEKEDYQYICDIIKLPQIKRYIQFLIEESIEHRKLSDENYQNLSLIVYSLQTIYNYGDVESPISDYDYDRLYELLEEGGSELITTHVPSNRIVHHKYKSLRGTLTKIYVLGDEKAANKSRASLDNWIKRQERYYYDTTGKKLDLWNEEIYVFPKWDGVSVVFEFTETGRLKRALTRGDTSNNEATDVTFIFSTIWPQFAQKMKGAYGLKTEVMMHQKDKDAYNKKYGTDYKSTRSIVSSILNSDSLDGRENLLEVVGLRTSTLKGKEESLQELAEDVFKRPYLRCRFKDIDAIRKFAYDNRSVNGLNCDGVVLYIIDEEIRKALGRKDEKNRYEVAFKFNEDIAYTKIRDIKFNLTGYGHIFPIAEFESTIMKGNVITNASLGSMQRFEKLNLAKGDTAKVLYEIIPYLTYDGNDKNCKRGGNKPIKAPKKCPECGEELKDWTCHNPDCGCRKRAKVIRYTRIIGMDGFADATVRKLFEAGLVKDISDLYELPKKIDKMVEAGFGKINSKNIAVNVQKSSTLVPAHVFLAAVGIEGIGKRTFEAIGDEYTLEDLLEIAKEKKYSSLMKINGIKDAKAKRIIDGLNENRKVIKELQKYVTPYLVKMSSKVKFIAVFHKIRSMILTDKLLEKGGIVEDNLTKRTSFLIVPDGFNGDSPTARKAVKYGVPIVEFDKVEKYVEKNFK